MRHQKTTFLFFFAGLVLLVAGGLWLSSARPASAQCGSQASSCKSCHEVQGQLPVNADGTAWHQSHAFGDFCYICHAGNNQAKDEAGAHAGMVAPLSDVQAACQQCHPADLQERAQVYAAALGVDIGSGSVPPSESEPVAAASAAADAEQPASPAAPADTSIDLSDPNLVDYAKTYDEIVLGKKPVHWGNAILLVLIGLVAVGGGGFVITREQLVHVSFGETKKAGDEYPAEVVGLLPSIAALNSSGRKSLKNVLANRKKAEKVLGLMDAVISDGKSEE
jgi:hypothetical protein